MLKREDIHIRDPFVVPVPEEGKYYLFGSTDDDLWFGKGVSFKAYSSTDLQHWEGPFVVFTPPEGFWADRCFWAPEVHLYNAKYYMFASFKADGKRRGSQVLVSDSILGPYNPLGNQPATPEEWDCLDGTFFLDEDGVPWMIFCHEFTQIDDGQICAIKLAPKLDASASKPIILFSASKVPWAKKKTSTAGHVKNEGYVTDGPYMYRAQNGQLLMLWSSFTEKGYAQGIARSVSGKVTGPWEHDPEAIYFDGGHGMLFRKFDGTLTLAVHSPNQNPTERPAFFTVEESEGCLKPVRG